MNDLDFFKILKSLFSFLLYTNLFLYVRPSPIISYTVIRNHYASKFFLEHFPVYSYFVLFNTINELSHRVISLDMPIHNQRRPYILVQRFRYKQCRNCLDTIVQSSYQGICKYSYQSMLADDKQSLSKTSNKDRIKPWCKVRYYK